MPAVLACKAPHSCLAGASALILLLVPRARGAPSRDPCRRSSRDSRKSDDNPRADASSVVGLWHHIGRPHNAALRRRSLIEICSRISDSRHGGGVRLGRRLPRHCVRFVYDAWRCRDGGRPCRILTKCVIASQRRCRFAGRWCRIWFRRHQEHKVGRGERRAHGLAQVRARLRTRAGTRHRGLRRPDTWAEHRRLRRRHNRTKQRIISRLRRRSHGRHRCMFRRRNRVIRRGRRLRLP